MTPQEALKLLLAHVDYSRGACRAGDQVEDVLGLDILAVCRKALGDMGPADRFLDPLYQPEKPDFDQQFQGRASDKGRDKD